MQLDSDFLCLGHCGRPHGLAGDVFFRPYPVSTQLSQVLVPGLKVIAVGEDHTTPLTVRKVWTGNKVRLGLDPIGDRTHLETLLPFELYASREDLPALEEEDYYLQQLLELEVWVEQEQQQLKYGRVAGLYHNGAQFILQIEDFEAKEAWEIPMAGDFVQNIDLEHKKVLVLKPDYI